MASDFKIGSTLLGIQSLDDILNAEISVDPDWSYQPYSGSIKLGNGVVKGIGFPIARWRWRGMTDENREVLKAFISSNISGNVYIQTAINDTSGGIIQFKKFYCVMNWPTQDEDFQADKVLDLTIIFTHMEIQP